MPLISWDPSFSVGLTSLDADHKHLIGMLNRIYDAWQAKRPDGELLNRLFDELLDYTDNHFAREETKLSARGYVGLGKHHDEHERLRELVMAFRTRHLAGGKVDQMTEEMAKFLKSWLVEHILGEDMKYRAVFAGQ